MAASPDARAACVSALDKGTPLSRSADSAAQTRPVAADRRIVPSSGVSSSRLFQRIAPAPVDTQARHATNKMSVAAPAGSAATLAVADACRTKRVVGGRV